MKYECAVPFDACRYITVDADSPEEAALKAEEKAGSVCLCHQCTDEIEMGEAMGVYVRDAESGEEVLDTTPNGDEVAKLKAELAAAQADVARLQGVAQAIRDYHFALDTRQHGGVAQDKAFNAISQAMDMHWVQGAEAAARAAQKGGA